MGGILIVSSLSGYFFFFNRTQLASAKIQISSLKNQITSATAQISTLQEKITPTRPTHNLTNISPIIPFESKLSSGASQIGVMQDDTSGNLYTYLSPPVGNDISIYWNVAWAGKDYELQQIVQLVNQNYHESHTYVVNEFDCIDMACDVWDLLLKKGIISLIAIGNLELKGETFDQCNHAWLMIPNSKGKYFALEVTNGQLYFDNSVQSNQYGECFLYTKPSDLRADIGSRW